MFIIKPSNNKNNKYLTFSFKKKFLIIKNKLLKYFSLYKIKYIYADFYLDIFCEYNTF